MARPRNAELRRRERAFVRLLAETGSFEQAVAGSRVDVRRLPKLLDAPTFRAVAAAVIAEAA